MRKFILVLSTFSLIGVAVAAPSNALSTKVKIAKPSAPTIISVVSSSPRNEKVNITVTLALPVSTGGAKITGSRVTAGGKSCKITKLNVSCTLKSIKVGKVIKVSAKSKNKKGFSPKSQTVSYTAGSIGYSLVAAPAVVAASPGTTPPAPIASTCATGGVCALGDIGPGGGFVYYVDNVTGFSCGETFSETGSLSGGLCHYLEVAKFGWDPSEDATGLPWMNTKADVDAIPNDPNYGEPNLSNSKIGLGHKNSVAIASVDSSNNAAVISLAYVNGAVGDWYLPSITELNLLCQWSRGVPQDATTACDGGASNIYVGSAKLIEQRYWSSSEVGVNHAWSLYMGGGFGAIGHWDKDRLTVRPIRAF